MTKRLRRRLNVQPVGSRQRGDIRPRKFTADRVYGFRIPVRGDGETGFEDIDAQFHQLCRHPDFLWHGHAASGRLFPVPESRVEDVDAICHAPSLSLNYAFEGAISQINNFG